MEKCAGMGAEILQMSLARLLYKTHTHTYTERNIHTYIESDFDFDFHSDGGISRLSHTHRRNWRHRNTTELQRRDVQLLYILYIHRLYTQLLTKVRLDFCGRRNLPLPLPCLSCTCMRMSASRFTVCVLCEYVNTWNTQNRTMSQDTQRDLSQTPTMCTSQTRTRNWSSGK